ncbi:MAG: hypothetical protein AAFU77_15515 [Myxococcota bacterium]
MAKKKQSRKELLREDDAFIQAANTGAEWFNDNRTLVIGAVIAVVVVVTGAVVATSSLASSAAAAADDLAGAMAVYQGALVSEDEADPAGDPPTFATEDARDSAAREAFAPLRGKSGPGLLATFYHASLSQKAGDVDAAATEFDSLLKNLKPNDNLYFLALERAAYAREASGNIDGALELWGRINGTQAFYADRAAYHRARLTEAKGQKQEAADLYAKLEAAFPESGMLESARNRLALLEEEGVKPAKTVDESAALDAETEGETTTAAAEEAEAQ